MRKLLLLVSLFAVLSVPALAGQTARVPLLNGVYSVEAPVDWHVKQEDDGSSATFAPVEGAPTAVIFTAPNPTVEGEIAEYAGVIMGVLFKSLGGGKVTNEEAGEFKGHPSILFHFVIDNGGQGLATVIDYDGYGVLNISMGPTAEFEAFWEEAAPILESYEFDAAAAKKNAGILDGIAAKLIEDLKKEMAK